MLTYKLYELDAKGRIAGPPHILQAESDERAVALAQRYLKGAPLELWQDARRIANLQPAG